MDLALNNLRRLICHKTKPNQTIHFYYILFYFISSILIFIYLFFVLNVFLVVSGGWPRGVMVKAVDCEVVVSSYSSRAITFTFWQIPLGKVLNTLVLPAMG